MPSSKMASQSSRIWYSFLEENDLHMFLLHLGKVEIFLEQREVAFLSPSKICEKFEFLY
jgi:hypothetical protein